MGIQATNVLLWTTEKQPNKCHRIHVQTFMYTLQSTAHENHTQRLFTLTLHTILISLLVWSSSPLLYFRGVITPDVDKVQGVGLIQTCMQTAM